MWRRVFLYQKFHGLTLARCYGALFLVWLAMMIIILFIRHFTKESLFQWEIRTTIIFILFLALFKIEFLIVKYAPPTVNNEVDYVYLSNLSPNGFEGWWKAFFWAQRVADDFEKKTKITSLENRHLEYAFWIVNNLENNFLTLRKTYEENFHWQRINFSSWQVFNELKKKNFYPQVINLKKRIIQIQIALMKRLNFRRQLIEEKENFCEDVICLVMYFKILKN